jgi:hypothetical protein
MRQAQQPAQLALFARADADACDRCAGTGLRQRRRNGLWQRTLCDACDGSGAHARGFDGRPIATAAGTTVAQAGFPWPEGESTHGAEVDVLEGMFAATLDALTDVVVQNLEWFLGFFAFFLAIRFAPAVISWFRHRNDPQQMKLF